MRVTNQKDRNYMLVITGPTASGKTSLSIARAQDLDGEIINCDSLQVFNDLKILTAIPMENEMFGIKHKLFGYLECTSKITAVDWAQSASKEIYATLGAGKTPILVGGTGMYINTLIDGIAPIPNVPDEVRARAVELANSDYEKLCQIVYNADSRLKSLIDYGKRRQMIRAYEVYIATGKPISYFYDLPKIKFIENIRIDHVNITVERRELYSRINSRFDEMIKNGAIEEVRALLDMIGITPGRKELFSRYPIFNAIGAKEITLFLDGVYTFDQMKEIAKQNSRHYAKRQITWFKKFNYSKKL